jgi:hypothetical protein
MSIFCEHPSEIDSVRFNLMRTCDVMSHQQIFRPRVVLEPTDERRGDGKSNCNTNPRPRSIDVGGCKKMEVGEQERPTRTDKLGTTTRVMEDEAPLLYSQPTAGTS